MSTIRSLGNAYEPQEGVHAMTETPRRPPAQEGFALILALLVLMMLTFLGLTLATTTSTELQIATNYRWSEQARYNAEAGVEAAKVILRDVPNWAQILPIARAGVTWTTAVPPGSSPSSPGGLPSADPQGRTLRNYENWNCDSRGGNVGYGLVLHDPGAATVNGPYQYRTNLLGQSVNGAFTLWIRRDILLNTDGTIRDNPADNVAVITVEGVAPYTETQVTTTRAQSNAAVKVLEVSLVRASGGSDLCETFRGQTGGASSGAGFWACGVISDTCAASSQALSRGLGDGAGRVAGAEAHTAESAGTLCDTGVR